MINTLIYGIGAGLLMLYPAFTWSVKNAAADAASDF